MALSIRRFVWILRDAGLDAVLMSKLTCAGETGEKPRPLNMKKNVITKAIGMDLSDKRICEILNSLDFGCTINDDELKIEIPPHRSRRDISIPNDIVEEVARIYGYDNVTPSMPQIEMRPYSFNTDLQKQHKIRRFLSGAKGFTEVHTYSWYDDFWLKRMEYDPGKTLTLQNPAAENNSRMRLEIIPNLLALVESNSLHRDRFFLYEFGNVYLPTDEGCDQPMFLAGVGYQSGKTGKIQDIFLNVKGVIEDILEISNTGEVRFKISETSLKPWHIEGSCMDIYVSDKYIGQLGYLENPFPEIFEKGTQIVWFELNVDKFSGPIYPDKTYENIPVYPGSWMDFSILADKKTVYADIEAVMKEFSNPVLKKYKFLYLYDGKGLPEGKISYTFRFWLGLPERTLTGDDLTEFRAEFLKFLEKQGFSIR